MSPAASKDMDDNNPSLTTSTNSENNGGDQDGMEARFADLCKVSLFSYFPFLLYIMNFSFRVDHLNIYFCLLAFMDVYRSPVQLTHFFLTYAFNFVFPLIVLLMFIRIGCLIAEWLIFR